MSETRIEHTNTIPITVQNIMLEHMQRVGLDLRGSNDALIGIAREMRKWGFVATDKMERREDG